MLLVICYGGKDGDVIGRFELEAGQSVAVPKDTRTIQVIDQGPGIWATQSLNRFRGVREVWRRG